MLPGAMLVKHNSPGGHATAKQTGTGIFAHRQACYCSKAANLQSSMSIATPVYHTGILLMLPTLIQDLTVASLICHQQDHLLHSRGSTTQSSQHLPMALPPQLHLQANNPLAC